MKYDDLVTAIFHEFVHIKQDVRREFPMFELLVTFLTMERPWEIEAYAEQEKMWKKVYKCLILKETFFRIFVDK